MNRIVHSRRSLLLVGAAATVLSLVSRYALAATFHIKVTVRYKDGPAAANAKVTVKELLSGNVLDPGDDTTWEFRTNNDGVAEGDLRNRRTVSVPDPTFENPRRTRAEDDALDNPAFVVTVSDDFGNSAGALELSWNGIGAISIELPMPMGDKRSVGRIFRRKNLATDFTATEQQQLSDLILGYLTLDLIHLHMDQVDHLDNLFTDHRSYLYEIEKRLIRDGHHKYVPLPIWDPLDDLPPGWHRVHSSHAHMPLRLHNLRPKFLRTNLPSTLRPENLAASGFATAQDLALGIGRSAWSASNSYHFFAHADLAGPFVAMSTAAAAVMFWGFHGVLVDVYEKWLSIVMPGQNRRTVLGRNGDGRLELFTVSSDGRLWHAWQRLKTPHREENDDLKAMVDVKFVHWSHWRRLGPEGREIADARVGNDHSGRLVVMAKARGDSTLFDRLQIMRQNDTGWSGWQQLEPSTSEIRDFAVALNSDNTLEIVCIRQSGNAFVVSTRTETAPRSNSFGPWRNITENGQYYRLAMGTYRTVLRRPNQRALRFVRPHLAVSTSNGDPLVAGHPGEMYHLWRVGSSWSEPWKLSDDLYVSTALERNKDDRPEIFAIRNSDRRVYHRYMLRARSTVRFGEEQEWSGWVRLGTSNAAFNSLAATRNDDGRLEVFGTDTDGRVHHIWQHQPNSGWSEWEEIPRLALMGKAEQPMAALDHTKQLKIFVHGEDNFTYLAEQSAPNQGPWIGWTNV